ncbi:GNAT family N-acetyltransferase [Micromonospora coxensis]|uniref:Acetyltransferase (GNAT) family protein n=1 Tax=Micromonospora coxensis TaxID=356852 RepID=A0A1C5J0E3_9ACTN|nr:GNAT family N-acetyltransferase [Micromonospora coxensis]SCG63933.1 Acetyltransferase (GNAT) family protein [Micromonospora coxensis]
MTRSESTVDLGATLRALRRHVDLSQRELADRSGVPQGTVARIESGRTADPGFRVVERLVRAVSGRLTISLPQAGTPLDAPGGAATCSLPAVPYEGLRDAADRNCPAHLDPSEVREPRDWPGAWWAQLPGLRNLPPRQFPMPLPATTWHRDRGQRDRRRAAERVRREFSVRRIHDPQSPTSWRFVAELPDGELIGELRAHERSPHLAYGGDETVWPRELVLDGVLVAREHRRLGIGRRLVDALVGAMAEAGVGRVHGTTEGPGVGLLAACGFRAESRALRMARTVSAAPGPPR